MGMPNSGSGSYFMPLSCSAVSNKGSGWRLIAPVAARWRAPRSPAMLVTIQTVFRGLSRVSAAPNRPVLVWRVFRFRYRLRFTATNTIANR